MREARTMLFIMSEDSTSEAKLGSLSYLKVTQYFAPFGFTTWHPLRSGLSIVRSACTRINFACSDSQERLSVLI